MVSRPVFKLFAFIQALDTKLFFTPFHLFHPVGRSPARLLQRRSTPDLTPNPATAGTHLLHHFRPAQTLLRADLPACLRDVQPRRLS